VLEGETEMLKVDEVYALYQKAAIVGGEPLSWEVFETLWNGIQAGDRAYWLRQFQMGTTTLSKEVIESLEEVFDALESGLPDSEDDTQLLAKLRQRIESGGMPS
jgi:hypothetical protein